MNQEILKQASEEAAKFSNFCQKFKMEIWKEDFKPVLHETYLDKLAMIAFNILKK